MTNHKKPTIVVINLGYGNLLSGFPHVTALLWEAENPRPLKFTGALPPGAELDGIYRRWHLIYQALYRRPGWHPRIKIDREDITNVSEVEFADICQHYIQLINEWLDAEEFRNIDRQLRSHLHQNDEIQLILETDDESVRRLPWHFWNFLSDYPKAEIALSTPEYQRVEKLHHRKQVRILAIFGNDNGLDLAADRQVLAEIADAETVFLVKPSRQEVDEQLWDDRGWDILFFAGHSESEGESEENRQRGLLAINPTEKIGISHLKLALKTAISRGLQLAIFNSCDGLGLATDLADLQIPQIIVMREPVADRVANAFLVQFIQGFSRGSSFYLAVRQARERLQGLEDNFPCASWLPIICQNPAELSMVWPQRSRPKKLGFSQLRDFAKAGGNRTFWLTSLGITLMILIIRQLGILQGWELKAYDYLMRSRPAEPPDPRILIVEITENDVQLQKQYPISDATLAQLLRQLEQHQPRAIGLTIYRDFPVFPLDSELSKQMQQQDNLFAVCSFPRKAEFGVSSPDAMPNNRLGFDDVVIDSDGILRRHLFFMKETSGCNTRLSLSFQLAQKYLAAENIKPVYPANQNNSVQMGQAIFKPMIPNTGGYKNLGRGGWYVMLNYRSFPIARTVTLTEVLQGEFNPNLVKDRIVIIGVTANSTSPKYFFTPYRVGQSPSDKVPGVMVQAQMVSHILSVVLDGRPIITVWVWWGEAIWIGLWSLVGSAIALCIGNREWAIAAISFAIGLLYIVCYLLFLQGTWVPLIPPALALVVCPLFFVIGDRAQGQQSVGAKHSRR